jgi:hypothetical protein
MCGVVCHAFWDTLEPIRDTSSARGLIAGVVRVVVGADQSGCCAEGGVQRRGLALSILPSRECLRSYEELLSGRPLDVTVERIGAEHAGE